MTTSKGTLMQLLLLFRISRVPDVFSWLRHFIQSSKHLWGSWLMRLMNLFLFSLAFLLKCEELMIDYKREDHAACYLPFIHGVVNV